MAIPQIDNLLFYAVTSAGQMYPNQFEAKPEYGFEPDGIGLYCHVRDKRIAEFKVNGVGLENWHAPFLTNILSWMYASEAPSKLINVGLEPPHWQYKVNGVEVPESYRKKPFDLVLENTDYIAAIAKELNGFQKEAKDNGKTLEIAIRFASEMNDRKASAAKPGLNAWGEQPDEYKEAFKFVRDIFGNVAPKIKFAFSPGIRADLDPIVAGASFNIANYYPGDQYVDYIGGTWYAGKSGNYTVQHSINYYKKYVTAFLKPSKPYALDEFAVGKDDTDRQNSIEKMMDTVTKIADETGANGRHFKYLNFFLAGTHEKNINLTQWS